MGFRPQRFRVITWIKGCSRLFQYHCPYSDNANVDFTWIPAANVSIFCVWWLIKSYVVWYSSCSLAISNAVNRINAFHSICYQLNAMRQAQPVTVFNILIFTSMVANYICICVCCVCVLCCALFFVCVSITRLTTNIVNKASWKQLLVVFGESWKPVYCSSNEDNGFKLASQLIPPHRLGQDLLLLRNSYLNYSI